MPVKPIHAKFWTSTGWIGVSLALLSLAAATIDGVMAMFLLPVAMLVGGISGFGVNATPRFGIATLILCTVIVVVSTHYVVTTGLMRPTASSLTGSFELIAIPLTVSAGLLTWGVVKRNSKAIDGRHR